ncbi:MAG: hypothetical protein GY866_32115 [Proteobacteria bacterium]|nr:hypothetical protein [Pseudomonadota bacterium]
MDIIHEQPHQPSADEHAQESWYFNWTDRKHDMFCLVRTGFKYHDRQPEPLILTISGNTIDFIYPTETVPKMAADWDKIDAAQGLVAGNMIATMEEPFKRWRIRLEGPKSMDLLFESYTPVYDYHTDGRKLASTMTTEHFEQSCRVTGWIDFNGRRLEIDGYGQRDKSWGVRKWPEIQGWDWISAQFGEKLSFNVMRTLENDEVFMNGFVYRDGRNFTISEATIEYEWSDKKEEPAGTRLEIRDEAGLVHSISAVTRGVFLIPKLPVVLTEAYSVFTYHGPGETLEGGGVVEHVWRA